jgi:acetate kinase
MGGVDGVVFNGGIGENSTDVRSACCSNMEFLGIAVDESRNSSGEKEKFISPEGARTPVLVIPTNEELVIAIDTMRIVSEKGSVSAR